MPASVQSPPTLRQFGKYLLDQEIARGGMARVYLARLRGLGGFEKKLVVKQVLPELASDPRFVEMFVEEAKTVVQMSHPHIVPVYELGVVDGVYFLAMEYVEGATLAEILRDGPLKPILVAHIGLQICDALSYAHERFSLVHRDVTPRNVIVDALGHVRLLDFGIAAKAEGALEGEVFGSHGYMSPEQAQGKIVEAKSDLFSLGTVVYESLTNEPAFLKQTTEETKDALLEGEPPSLGGHEAIPDVLSALIDECFRYAPQERPKDAREIGKRLRGFLAAKAPEGVAPELGQRAEAAMVRRNEEARQPEPSAEGPTKPDGSVRTIATSVTLRKILGGDDTDPDEAGTVPIVGGGRQTAPDPTDEMEAAPDDDSQDRTMPIPGRVSLSDLGTTPLERAPKDEEEGDGSNFSNLAEEEGDGSNFSNLAEEGDGSNSSNLASAESERETPAAGPRKYAWIGLAVLALAGVFAVRGLSETTTNGETVPADHVDEPPDVEGPRPESQREGSSPTASGEASGLETETETETETGTGTETGTETGTQTETGTATETAASATLTINARPWGDYYLDNRRLSGRRISNARIRAGSHTLGIENDALLGPDVRVTARFDAAPGASITATINLNDADPSFEISSSR